MTNPWQLVLGQERLWVVFWLYCVLGTFLLTLLLLMSDLSAPAIVDTLSIFYLVYLLWAHYSLWTCAFNAKWRPWGYAARVYACVLIAVTTVSFLWPTFVRTGPIEVRLIQ
jgi:hypothetical protein